MEQIGRYKIVGELGRGAMGVVFQAQDPAIGRMIAIKSIRLSELTDESERARLRERLFREAQSAGILSHPGIVTIYDIAEEDGMAYIFMELVNGPPLDRLLKAERLPDKETLFNLLRQTAAALDYAHKKGIVHRDVKPSNIMVHDDGTAKVTDFGVAKIVSQQMTRAGTIMGTPSYMSPEQVQGTPVSGQSDQFSLAVIAYEILTGEKPFVAEYLPTLLFKIVGETPVAPHQLNPTVSPDVEPVMRKALAKIAEERYETCSEFVAALAAACADSPWVPQPHGASHNLPTAGSGDRIHAPISEAFAETLFEKDAAPAEELTVAPVETQPSPAASAPIASSPAVSSMDVEGEATPADVSSARGSSVEIPAVAAAPAWTPRPREDVSSMGGLRNVFLGLLAALIVVACVVLVIKRGMPNIPPETPLAQISPSEQPDAKPEPAPAVAPTTQPAVDPASTVSGASASSSAASSAASSVSTTASTGTENGSDNAADNRAGRSSGNVDSTADPGGDVATFHLTTAPPGASATVDGLAEERCTSPCALSLPLGRHTIMIRRNGYRDVQRVFTLPDDPGLIVNLVALTGILNLVSTPPGLVIFVDGQEQARKTPASVSLPVGTHRVQIVKGSEKQDFSVEIRDGVFTERSVDWGN